MPYTQNGVFPTKAGQTRSSPVKALCGLSRILLSGILLECVLNEDEELRMIYGAAVTRSGGKPN